MTDVGFPVIRYKQSDSPAERGQLHGREFADGIAELVAIRRDLMRQKNPGLTPAKISRLAQQQLAATAAFDPSLAAELQGIAVGAGLAVDDLVVLNNYTDFRDIHIPDQGCSTVYINRQSPVAGQTWDMHRTAKDFVCCIELEADEPTRRQVLFSLVGCLGMMGYNGRGLMIGVNNINTDGAVPGVVWPALVRAALLEPTRGQMTDQLRNAQVTSGHAYLVASPQGAEFWEIMPRLAEQVSSIELPDRGHLFHTNHCLGSQAKRREIQSALSSTTAVRYELLEKKIGAVNTLDDCFDLLNDHENYPMSICSNYQSGAQDPSVTCGGAVGRLDDGLVVMWRGDPLYDSNFVRREFQLGATIRG